MATYVAPVPQLNVHEVERETRGWTSWITTTDHKRIGIMYMVTTLVFFCLGGVEALMIRLQLGTPNNTLVTPAVYNQLFTMHGTTMVFLFVLPSMAGLANCMAATPVTPTAVPSSSAAPQTATRSGSSSRPRTATAWPICAASPATS